MLSLTDASIYFDSITAETVERRSVSDVLINNVPFLDITRTIACLSASHATKYLRNLNEMRRFQ